MGKYSLFRKLLFGSCPRSKQPLGHEPTGYHSSKRNGTRNSRMLPYQDRRLSRSTRNPRLSNAMRMGYHSGLLLHIHKVKKRNSTASRDPPSCVYAIQAVLDCDSFKARASRPGTTSASVTSMPGTMRSMCRCTASSRENKRRQWGHFHFTPRCMTTWRERFSCFIGRE